MHLIYIWHLLIGIVSVKVENEWFQEATYAPWCQFYKIYEIYAQCAYINVAVENKNSRNDITYDRNPKYSLSSCIILQWRLRCQERQLEHDLNVNDFQEVSIRATTQKSGADQRTSNVLSLIQFLKTFCSVCRRQYVTWYLLGVVSDCFESRLEYGTCSVVWSVHCAPPGGRKSRLVFILLIYLLQVWKHGRWGGRCR